MGINKIVSYESMRSMFNEIVKDVNRDVNRVYMNIERSILDLKSVRLSATFQAYTVYISVVYVKAIKALELKPQAI